MCKCHFERVCLYITLVTYSFLAGSICKDGNEKLREVTFVKAVSYNRMERVGIHWI